MNLVIHFWLKSGKHRELESQKARESQGTLLKKLGGNPEEVSHNFAEFAMVKACLLRVNFFWYSPYSGKEAGSVLLVLHQAIKIRFT